ncbi:DUF2917 domain-containing protein, partial [Streptococcus pyogenes]|uniref:DUF2917 domain-containing protein n=1 Tax=Streptococcus pyogenes TaxID=1314 RepID=UPI003DA13558
VAVLKYDEWPQNSAVVIECKRTALPATFQFGPNACKSVTLRADRPLKLTCVIGSIWFTKELDTADYVLGTGQSMVVSDARSVVVFAIQFGLLRVEAVAT